MSDMLVQINLSRCSDYDELFRLMYELALLLIFGGTITQIFEVDFF